MRNVTEFLYDLSFIFLFIYLYIYISYYICSKYIQISTYIFINKLSILFFCTATITGQIHKI